MTGVSYGRAWAAAGVLLALGLACGCTSEDEGPKNGNGVNDVRLACEIRTKWNRSNEECGLCEAGVISPRCECSELKDFSALCIDQQNARKQACAESVEYCISACDRSNCDCIDGCYANAEACKKAAAARDGCITDACESYCK